MRSLTPLISPEALQIALADKNSPLSVIDASWHLPNSDRDSRKEFEQTHIPRAVFFDIDTVSDQSSSLPHMLPSARSFAESMRQLGVGPSHRVVVYDTHGLFSAARVWWMFKVFGHENVQLLDGGLPGWVAQGGEVEQGMPTSKIGDESLAYQLDANAVAHLTDVAKAITDSSATLLDARPKARFDGIAPEPRKGLKGGHMPGAVSMPITDLLAVGENDVKRLKPVAELQKYFADKGVQTNDAVITTCGSGVTAAIISLALVIAGHVPGRLYDGSWSEWGAATDTAVETS